MGRERSVIRGKDKTQKLFLRDENRFFLYLLKLKRKQKFKIAKWSHFTKPCEVFHEKSKDKKKQNTGNSKKTGVSLEFLK